MADGSKTFCVNTNVNDQIFFIGQYDIHCIVRDVSRLDSNPCYLTVAVVDLEPPSIICPMAGARIIDLARKS